MDNIIIKINNLSLSFNKLSVLQDISFNVKESDLIAIVGPSGCGKTTLLKAIGGLISKNNDIKVGGSISIENRTPTEERILRRFGFAFQNPVLLDWRTVIENIKLPLEIITPNSKIEGEKINEVLKLMDLYDFKDYYPFELSGGMKQRVSLARSIIYNPPILLMDEPFGSLDEITRENLNIEFRKILALKKSTIILVTHSLKEAVFLANKVIILTKRPSNIKSIIDIDLPCERGRDLLFDESFSANYKRVVYEFYK